MIILNKPKRWLNSDDIEKVLLELEKTELNKEWMESNAKAKQSRENNNYGLKKKV